MTAAFLRPTTHWGKLPPRPPVVSRRRFPGASSIRGGGLPIFKRLKFLSLQTKGMLTAGQLETESLKVIENGRCKSSNVSRAPYQKHQKHEKHQKLNATSLLLNTTAKREQPRTQRSESYSSMKNNAFRNLSVWFMVWYGSIGNINHKLVDSRFQQLTYDNLFLLNKPSRSGFWTREACLKWFPWVRKTSGLGWSCWSSCSLTNRDGLPLPHHITFTNVSRTICAFTPFAQTRSLVCWFSHLLTPGALGLVRLFESNSGCQTSWYPWVPHVPRDTNWHQGPPRNDHFGKGFLASIASNS